MLLLSVKHQDCYFGAVCLRRLLREAMYWPTVPGACKLSAAGDPCRPSLRLTGCPSL